MIKYLFLILLIYALCFFCLEHKKQPRANITAILKKLSSLSINHIVIYEDCIEIEGKTQTFNKLFSTLNEITLCKTLKTNQTKTYVYFTT